MFFIYYNMDDIPSEVFLNIGKQMASNEPYEVTNVLITKKTVEEYKKNYKDKLELQLARIKKTVFDLEVEIFELERKNNNILSGFSNKKYSSSARNFLSNNNMLLKYFLSLNNLETEKFKLNSITLQNLKEQYEIQYDIYIRTEQLLNNLLKSYTT
jgi:hypothetical protein